MSSRSTALCAVVALLCAAPVAGASGAPLLTTADHHSFDRLSASLGGRNGIAVSALGSDQTPTAFGSLTSGVAWSTIKTAIAVATEQRSGGDPSTATKALLRRAITASDNAAAQSLWDKLGGGRHSAGIVQKVLASAGDSSTHVQPAVTRPGYTAFGQTVWTLEDQVRFTAALPCLKDSAPVLALMGQVVPSQAWGLGTTNLMAAFKGGWGPSPSGPYLVRQMGILHFPGGHPVAVTIATIAADGSFGSGTANLTKIAGWLKSHVDPSSAPAQRC